MAKRDVEGSNRTLVLHLDHKLFLLVHLETDQYDALMNECDLTTLIKFLQESVVLAVRAGLQRPKYVMHELSIDHIVPGVAGEQLYLRFGVPEGDLRLRAVDNPKELVESSKKVSEEESIVDVVLYRIGKLLE